MCQGASRLAVHAVLGGGSHTVRREVEKRGSAAIRYPWTNPQQRVRPAYIHTLCTKGEGGPLDDVSVLPRLGRQMALHRESLILLDRV